MRARSSALLRIASARYLARAGPVAPATAGVGDAAERDAAETSLLGSYLAGRLARGLNDTTAAATYYGGRCSAIPATRC